MLSELLQLSLCNINNEKYEILLQNLMTIKTLLLCDDDSNIDLSCSSITMLKQIFGSFNDNKNGSFYGLSPKFSNFDNVNIYYFDKSNTVQKIVWKPDIDDSLRNVLKQIKKEDMNSCAINDYIPLGFSNNDDNNFEPFTTFENTANLFSHVIMKTIVNVTSYSDFVILLNEFCKLIEQRIKITISLKKKFYEN